MGANHGMAGAAIVRPLTLVAVSTWHTWVSDALFRSRLLLCARSPRGACLVRFAMDEVPESVSWFVFSGIMADDRKLVLSLARASLSRRINHRTTGGMAKPAFSLRRFSS